MHTGLLALLLEPPLWNSSCSVLPGRHHLPGFFASKVTVDIHSSLLSLLIPFCSSGVACGSFSNYRFAGETLCFDCPPDMLEEQFLWLYSAKLGVISTQDLKGESCHF